MPATHRNASFVGRQHELAVLGECLAAAARGEGGVALVVGEPGIGKTRLLSELADRARADGWTVLSGRAYDSEGMPPYLTSGASLEGELGNVGPGDSLGWLRFEAAGE
jgi:ATP-dependent Clp protease ATP-binding subunit ClpA